MKNIFNLNLAAIVLVVLMFPAGAQARPSALAAYMPVEFYEKLVPAGNLLIASVKWPQESEKLGFKHLSIGDSFNLENWEAVHAYVIEDDYMSHNGKPFSCILKKSRPLFGCKMTLWNDPKNFPQNLQDMSSAFGEKVSLSFDVLLSHALSKSELGQSKFGTGRIISIEIENREPSPDFVAKTTSFFSEKLNSQPVVRTTYKNATEIYSKQCIESIGRIEKKPILELSLKDKDELKKCENEAILAYLKGGGSSKRATVYEWKSPDGLVNVSIISLEKKTSVGGGMPKISSDLVAIFIKLDAEDAMNSWSESYNQTKKEFENDKDKKTKSDF